MKYGAMEKRFQSNVRKPIETDEKDQEWRPISKSDKIFIITPREIEEQRRQNKIIPYEYWKRNA